VGDGGRKELGGERKVGGNETLGGKRRSVTVLNCFFFFFLKAG
jgi:hypothetical protein